MSIRSQVLVAILAISALTIVGFAALSLERVQSRAHTLAFNAAQENAQVMGVIASQILARRNITFERAIRVLLQHKFSIGASPLTRVQIYDKQGTLRLDTKQGKEKTQQASAVPKDVGACLQRACLRHPIIADSGFVSASVSLRRGILGPEVVGVLRVTRQVVGVRQILASIIPEIAIIAAMFLVIASVGAFLAGGAIAKPIVRLTEATRKIAGGARATPLPIPRGREVLELTLAYHEMRKELEDKRQIEELTQDLSHELKNPITAVLTLTEALEEAMQAQASDAVLRLNAQITSSANRLNDTVSDLLALARLESKGVGPFSTVHLGTLLDEVIEDVKLYSRGRAITIDAQHQHLDTLLQGDPLWLRRALRNMVANALENSPVPSPVEVYCERREKNVLIRISNQGEIPKAIRARIFERFVSRRKHGTGLGMSIARTIFEAHGGQLTLEQAGPPRVTLCAALKITP